MELNLLDYSYLQLFVRFICGDCYLDELVLSRFLPCLFPRTDFQPEPYLRSHNIRKTVVSECDLSTWFNRNANLSQPENDIIVTEMVEIVPD